jgi:hypothetical protein
MGEVSAIEFCNVKCDGSRYVEAIFNVGAPAYDILGILFLETVARPDAGDATFELSGRIRFHVDDKHFDSDDPREWFRYSIKTSATPNEAISRVEHAFHLLSLKAAVQAAKKGLTDPRAAVLIALAGDVFVVPVGSADPFVLAHAVETLPGTEKRAATPEEAAKWNALEKLETN